MFCGLLELPEEDVGIAEVGVRAPLRAPVAKLGCDFQTLLKIYKKLLKNYVFLFFWMRGV